MRELQNVYEVTITLNNTIKKYNVIGANIRDALSNLSWRGRPFEYNDEDEQHQQANLDWDNAVNNAKYIECVLKNVIV